jgi:hypothetical protein
MLAEKMADAVIGKKPLKSSNTSVWVDSNWKKLQRLTKPTRELNY